MEKVSGKTLADILRMDPSGETLLSLVPSIASALKKLHMIGVVHRDAHFENIYIQPDNRVTFIDFGRADKIIGHNGKMDISNIKRDYVFLSNFRTNEEFSDIENIDKIYEKFVISIDPYANDDIDEYKQKVYKFTGFKFSSKKRKSVVKRKKSIKKKKSVKKRKSVKKSVKKRKGQL